MKFSTKKTIATFLVLKDKVEFNVGAVVLIQMIVYWFNSCNIKKKCDSIHRTDELRTPRTLNCNCIIKLKKHPSTEVIPNCESSGTRRMKKLTTYIADAFKRPTKCNINTARYLLENYLFSYVLSAMFSQDPLEKLFGQTRQRCGGNYFIDIVEIMAVMKMPILHQPLQHDLLSGPCYSYAQLTRSNEVQGDLCCGIPTVKLMKMYQKHVFRQAFLSN